MEQTHNRIDLLNMLACGLTASRMMASQTAVLTTIARFPGIQSGGICNHTRLSSSNVGRLLEYLSATGDIAYSAMPGSGNPGESRLLQNRADALCAAIAQGIASAVQVIGNNS